MVPSKNEADALFVEWTKQVLDAVKKDRCIIDDIKKSCHDCRGEVYKRLGEIEKRIAIQGVKIAVIVSVAVILLGYVLKHLEMRW